MEIRAGLEPVIAAVKGLCPNQLDERTIGQGENSLHILRDRMVGNQNIINSHMQQSG